MNRLPRYLSAADYRQNRKLKMEVSTLQVGKVVKKPLVDLIAEHIHLSDTCSWYICILGKKLQEAEAEIERLKDILTEIALKNDSIFPKMQHCKVCGGRDVGVMGHALNCKFNQALTNSKGE